MIDDRLRALSELGQQVGEGVHEFLIGKGATATIQGGVVILPLSDQDLRKLSDYLRQQANWSAEAIELVRQQDRTTAMRVRQLCDAFARVLEQALRDGRLDCGRGPDLQLAVADRARGLSVGIRMATIEIEGLLAESRARDLYWRAQSAIEFKEEAFKTAESLLQGTDDPAKRIAAVAIIDLAWRQMASAVVRAIRERNKQLPFSREKNLGELGQYLFEQAAIDAGQLAAFNEANQIRNEALHAATLGVVPSRDRALRMLATAIEYRARSGLPA